MSRRPPNKPTRRRAGGSARKGKRPSARGKASVGGDGGADQQTLVLGRIEPIEMQEEMERSFLDYSMSVITMRALPDVRDGLKPVQRRILYAMQDRELAARPDVPHKKCARITGHVCGQYHPHGTPAAYDALVRLAQDFSLRYPLIDGHGNFGSPDMGPAAERYTEARLGALAMELLNGIDENTVDFQPNYTNEFEEPTVLPARYPNLLVNGADGIAVAMATKIPTHNLGEIIDATNHVIDNPQATPKDLMKFVKGPDFPTGGIILGRQGIQEAYLTGRGSIKVRGRAEIDEGRRGTEIVVTEIPYQTSIGSIAARIAELVNNKQLDGIRNINDASAQGQTRLVIELKPNANANVVLNNLYKMTALQTTYPVNMVALVDGIPRTLNLAQAISAYVDHQIEVIRRRSKFRLEKAEARAHIVEGLLKALGKIDAIIKLIRGSADRDDARKKLMAAPHRFSEIQSNYILDMTLAKLTRLGVKETRDELAQLQATIKELKSILASDKKVRGVIKDDLDVIKKKYNDERRTALAADVGDMDIEDLIADEQIVVVRTEAGYIKTVQSDKYRTQKRGGRGVQGANLKEADLVCEIVHATTHAHLLLFSNQGRVFRLRAHEIPMKERTARGVALVNLLPLRKDESIAAVIAGKDFDRDGFLFFATKQGQVKKTPIREYDKSRKEGFIAINLVNRKDELVRVIETTGKDDIIIVTHRGQSIRFTEANVRAMGRGAAGVRGIRLKPDDKVVSCDVVDADGSILIVTDAGFGKRTKLSHWRRIGRGGQGIRAIKLNERKGHVSAAFLVRPDDEVFMVSSGGITVRIPVGGVSEQGRDATGVRVMNLERGQRVASAAPVFSSRGNGEGPAAEEADETVS